MTTTKPPPARVISAPDIRRSLNFTTKGVPRLSASTGQAVRPPPRGPIKAKGA